MSYNPYKKAFRNRIGFVVLVSAPVLGLLFLGLGFTGLAFV